MSGIIGRDSLQGTGTIGQKSPTHLTYRRVELAGAGTTGGDTLNLGGITFTEPGIWLVEIHLRFKHTEMDAYHRMALSTSSSAGDVFTEWRMIQEHISTGTNTFSNIGLNANWLIDLPLGVTSQPIRGSFKSQNSGSGEGQSNDSNGRPYMWAIKVKETRTSGSTPTEIRTA